MTFTAAVASGEGPVSVLLEACRFDAGARSASSRHADAAVAWSTTSRWIDTSDDGEVLAVLDGRLHNLWSASAGQAELILQRYRGRGGEVADGLLGDFVLIILDRRSGTLLVARDPVGVRPWYHAPLDGGHVGASDLAAVAALPGVDTTVNEPLAIRYLAAIEESRGETLVRGIRTLPPGQTLHLEGGRSRTTTHHRWALQPDLAISWEAASERCRTLLEQAVSDRLRSGGPPTSELSGGLDSSSVVGTVVRLGHDDLLVGRMMFEGLGADERRYSDAVIDHWKLPALSVPPWVPTRAESMELARRLRRPVPDPNFTMFASLHRSFLADGRSDCLTGLGGDDAFVDMGIGPRVVSAVQLRQRQVIGRLGRWAVRHPRRVWPQLVRPTLGHVASPWRGGWSPAWVSAAAKARIDLPRISRIRPVPVTGVAAIDERLDTLTSGYFASILETRASVTGLSGIRESHPFLDPRLVEATYGLNPWWPVRGGHYRALEVAAFSDRLPPLVAERRTKAEFSEVCWPQLDASIVDAVRTGPLRDLGWLDVAGFDAVVDSAKKGRANAALPLSRCVAVDQWMRIQ
jgi:asparagine synthetase B (glutamine-hydrolysing)